MAEHQSPAKPCIGTALKRSRSPAARSAALGRRAGIEAEGSVDALGLALTYGVPDLHGLLVRDQQPAQLSAIGMVVRHLATQGGESAEPSGRRKPLELSNSLSAVQHRQGFAQLEPVEGGV